MIDLTQLKVEHQLGAGSQGKVFLASDPEGSRFTVKLAVVDDRADRKLIFERAAQFRADRLDSSMVPILSYGMVSNTPPALARQLGKMSKDALVLVMPFVPGTTLAEVEATGSLTLKEATAAMTGIAGALARLPPGVNHGDLRAPNIFIRPSGEVALSDPDLTNRPNAAEDVRMLAPIGLNLGRMSAPDPNALAVAKLKNLIEQIATLNPPLTAAEVAGRFGEISAMLGAPAGNVPAVLAKRVKELEAAPVAPASTPWDEPESRRAPLVAAATGVTIVLLLGVWAAVHWLGGPRVRPESAGFNATEELSADSLYDHTGKVSYPEIVRVIHVPKEHFAANDGLVQMTFEYPIERVALLSREKEVLWEVRRPQAGSSVYLDVKPDRYFVEEDRDLGDAGLQKDLRLVPVDKRNPLRVTITREIVSAPRPEGKADIPQRLP